MSLTTLSPQHMKSRNVAAEVAPNHLERPETGYVKLTAIAHSGEIIEVREKHEVVTEQQLFGSCRGAPGRRRDGLCRTPLIHCNYAVANREKAMSSLRSALDELGTDDLTDSPTGQLGDDLVELREMAEALEAEWIRRLDAFDARQGWAADGSLSLGAWLRSRCGMTAAAASDRSRLARALRKMPLTQQAFLGGDITTAHVRALAPAAEAHPEPFARDEHVLLKGAATVSAGDTRKLIAYWRQNLDWDAALVDTDKIHQSRRLSISRTWEGMVRIDGDLDPESGEVILTAIGALVDESVKSGDANDRRTPTQRRADALTDLCRQFLDSSQAAISGGERPHINLLIDLDTLEGRAGTRCELASGLILHP